MPLKTLDSDHRDDTAGRKRASGGRRKRMLQLDVLRAIAVVLVLLYHWPHDIVVPALVKPFKVFGWTGVDLFFVLSGFLVSGLLFKEYKREGRVRIGRFLIRRGFKIYPAFYTLIAATLLVLLVVKAVPNERPLSAAGIVGELFFLQNYVGNLWGHTWSLAVEEHFYLSLGLFVLLQVRRSRKGSNPFVHLPKVFFTVASFCLLARIVGVLQSSTPRFVSATHLRMDALTFGVLLSYFYNFHSEQLTQLVRRKRLSILLASLALILPSFLLNYYSPLNLTIGLTMLYLGFGGILILSVYTDVYEGRLKLLLPLFEFLALIGFYSYSIYLWHQPMLYALPKLFAKVTGAPPVPSAMAVIVTASVVIGILMALMVESPFLRLRDRLFPS